MLSTGDKPWQILLTLENMVNTILLHLLFNFEMFDDVVHHIQNGLLGPIDKRIHLLNWEGKEGDWIEGEVIKVENGFGTFKPEIGFKTLTVMPNIMTNNNIQLGSKLKVTTKPSPDGQKTYIKDLEVIKY